MEKEIIIPSEYNAAFLNVTLSIKPDINGRYALANLMNHTKGDWWINPGIASKIKYVFPVKKNEILGVFEVVSFEEVEIEVNKTNYVVKLIQIDEPKTKTTN